MKIELNTDAADSVAVKHRRSRFGSRAAPLRRVLRQF
jgi:hypothetical protein